MIKNSLTNSEAKKEKEKRGVKNANTARSTLYLGPRSTARASQYVEVVLRVPHNKISRSSLYVSDVMTAAFDVGF